MLTLALVAAGGYAAWRAYRAGADALGGAWDSVSTAAGAAYDAVTDTLAAPFVAARDSNLGRIVGTNIMRPAVPVGGQSVQRPHVTDLPEGSYRAAEMYWSLYPDAVFYD